MAVLALLPHCGGLTSPEAVTPLDQQGDFATGGGTFVAVADAHVDSVRPDKNFGAASQLYVDDAPVEYRSFLRFEVSGLKGPVKRAVLRLFVTNGSGHGPVVRLVDSDWKEDSVTFDRQPAAVGPTLSGAKEVRAGRWVELDVTSAVTGNGTRDFGLFSTDIDGADFASREDVDPAMRPRLVVETREPTAPPRTPAPDWSWHRGGAGDERVTAMASAEDGLDFLVAGAFKDSGDFGGEIFQGERGLVVARYGADGSHQWSRAYAVGERVEATGLAVATSGEVWVVGAYQGDPDLGTGALTYIEEASVASGIFLLKLSPEGTPLWSRGFRAELSDTRSGLARAQAVTLDSRGSVIITGHFTGEMGLGRGRLYADPGNRTRDDSVPALFLAKFHASGAHDWSLAFPGGDEGSSAEALATDGAGFIYIGGHTDSWLLNATGGETPFLGKLSANGTPQWFRAFNGAKGSIRALTPMARGDVAFVGDVSGRFSFDGKEVEASEDVLLGTLHETAADGWARVMGGAGAARGQSLGRSSKGELVVAGWTRDAKLDLGGGALGSTALSRGEVLHFVARYDSTGKHLDARELGSTAPDSVALQVTYGGQARLCVPFTKALAPGDASYTSRGAGDLLFLQLTH
ncbi:DNRLRE domain-containing protein [Myxococcus faecalis]|uniref:CBM96 family carbohydrate-binding protein n=1 Tax=Myxococcus faecalis TaxID=3115646 RepID=UPI003CF10E9A